MTTVEPPFAYLGGKRVLLPFLLKCLPKNWDKNRYIEPFMGSGILALNIPYKIGIVSDIEFSMIHLYNLLKSDRNLPLLRNELETIFKQDEKPFFNQVKKLLETDAVKNDEVKYVAYYVYMRRRSTMGRCYMNKEQKYVTQYRMDQKNLSFQSVWNKITEISKTLQTKKLEFSICEFEKTLEKARKGDFVLLDPPYFDLEQPTKYYSVIFTVEQQLKLIKWIHKLDKRGCYVMLFNMENKKVIESLPKFHCTKIPASNKKNSCYANHTEILLTNYLI